MKRILFVVVAALVYMSASTASGAVLYSDDFSSDPNWKTDDPSSFYWDATEEALFVRTTNGPQDGSPDRFMAVETDLSPNKSYTLTWRQKSTTMSGNSFLPFGVLSSSLATTSTTTTFAGGYVHVYTGGNPQVRLEGLESMNKTGSFLSIGSASSAQLSTGIWYQVFMAFDAIANTLRVEYFNEETNRLASRLDFPASYGMGPFGSAMNHIGVSMYALARGTAAAATRVGYHEALIDDVRLEDESVLPVETTLSANQAAPIGGAPGTEFTLSLVYTDTKNRTPQTAEVRIGSSTYAMEYDDDTASTSLRDSDYRNGEAYRFKTILTERGEYSVEYRFTNSATTTTVASDSIRVGYSNVAFLPGVQSSYLYREGIVGDNELWLPNVVVGTDDDIEDLFMDEEGRSVRDDIYTRDEAVIDTAYTRYPIYAGFLEHMEEMVASGTINAWKPIAYDWRLDLETLLTHGVENDGIIDFNVEGTYIIDQLRELASTSDSGRVSILSHSNGGLLAKALLAKLEAENDPLLKRIDLLVLVAVPQLGTPKALLPVLHGAENHLSSILLDDATWRGAARNTPGALQLLPSEAYFDAVETPVITFDSALDALTETIRLRDQAGYEGLGIESVKDYRTDYGNDISSASELGAFLRGEEGRIDAAYRDVSHPANLEDSLLDDVSALHDVINAWTPPDMNEDGVADIKVVQVAGTGVSTISGVRYIAARHLNTCGGDCSQIQTLFKIQATPEYTMQGDGTVMMDSAKSMSTQSYFIDLAKYNRERNINGDVSKREHANIMAAQPVLNVVTSLVRNGSPSSDYLSQDLPASMTFTVIEMHSPVELSIADAFGNRSGYAFDTTMGTRTIETSIPNSTYERIGESVFVTVPSSGRFTLSLDGLASSTFTMKIKRYENDTLVASSTYTDVPTAVNMVGTGTLETNAASATLAIDMNGDGRIDTVRMPDGTNVDTAISVLKDYRVALKGVSCSKILRETLLLMTSAAELFIQKKQPQLAKATIDAMKVTIEKGVKAKQIARSDADILIGILNKARGLIQ